MLCLSPICLPSGVASAFCGDHFAKVRFNEASINFVLQCRKTRPFRPSAELQSVFERAELSHEHRCKGTSSVDDGERRACRFRNKKKSKTREKEKYVNRKPKRGTKSVLTKSQSRCHRVSKRRSAMTAKVMRY